MEETVQQGMALPAAVQIAVILSNLCIRLAAIAAGVYIAKLGHDTIVREAKGDVEFKGKLGTLKANIPGPFFVLLGAVTIGWALATPVKGSIELELSAAEPARQASSAASDEAVNTVPFDRPE